MNWVAQWTLQPEAQKSKVLWGDVRWAGRVPELALAEERARVPEPVSASGRGQLAALLLALARALAPVPVPVPVWVLARAQGPASMLWALAPALAPEQVPAPVPVPRWVPALVLGRRGRVPAAGRQVLAPARPAGVVLAREWASVQVSIRCRARPSSAAHAPHGSGHCRRRHHHHKRPQRAKMQATSWCAPAFGGGLDRSVRWA